jgi:hypothetical protein
MSQALFATLDLQITLTWLVSHADGQGSSLKSFKNKKTSKAVLLNKTCFIVFFAFCG